jgi:hypothetical protein
MPGGSIILERTGRLSDKTLCKLRLDLANKNQGNMLYIVQSLTLNSSNFSRPPLKDISCSWAIPLLIIRNIFFLLFDLGYDLSGGIFT